MKSDVGVVGGMVSVVVCPPVLGAIVLAVTGHGDSIGGLAAAWVWVAVGLTVARKVWR
jgi:hypothetical protein